MRRVIEPLERMGATLDADDGRPPLTIRGGRLNGIEYAPPVASAQVKTAVLLAGLHAAGTTRVVEALRTRDHTERALVGFGAAIRQDAQGIAVTGGARLQPVGPRESPAIRPPPRSGPRRPPRCRAPRS